MPTEHHPLQPAPFRRGIRLGRAEWIGIPLLVVLPLLALSGQLGPTEQRLTARGTVVDTEVELELRYPSRLRHRAGAQLWIGVRNTGQRPLEETRLLIDEAYLAHFTNLHPWPSGSSGWASSASLPLPRLAAGEHTVLRIDADAADWGHHAGWVALSPGRDPSPLRLAFSTLVWP